MALRVRLVQFHLGPEKRVLPGSLDMFTGDKTPRVRRSHAALWSCPGLTVTFIRSSTLRRAGVGSLSVEEARLVPVSDLRATFPGLGMEGAVQPGASPSSSGRLRIRLPDPVALRRAVAGADAVLSGLGAHRRSEAGVASRGTQAIVVAMRAEGARRLVGVSAAPVGTVASPAEARPGRRTADAVHHGARREDGTSLRVHGPRPDGGRRPRERVGLEGGAATAAHQWAPYRNVPDGIRAEPRARRLGQPCRRGALHAPAGRGPHGDRTRRRRGALRRTRGLTGERRQQRTDAHCTHPTRGSVRRVDRPQLTLISLGGGCMRFSRPVLPPWLQWTT